LAEPQGLRKPGEALHGPAMNWTDQYELLTDAEQVSVLGGVFLVIAAFALVMEWRRNRTRDLARLDKVGWMPWTTLFMLTAMIGAGCLAVSLKAVAQGY
jgi:hypothetical protein